MPTLDTEFHQVLFDFFADPNGLFWHHRLLVVPLGGSLWVGVTPDESVQRVDLADHRVIFLARNAAFPAARRNDSYVFDEDAFTPAARDRLVAACRTLAAVHGGGVVAGAGWACRVLACC